MTLSIIIPVLNEAENLSRVLQSVQVFRCSGHEVIVVDGGSSDNSLVLAREASDLVVTSAPGRALQMNCGAEEATGDVYLFLHADTVLPDDALTLLSALDASVLFWGRFDIQLSSNKTVFRLIEWLMNRRSRLTSIVTGDQALFVERRLFKKIKGFPAIALMEDIAISRALKKYSAPVCLSAKVISSSRRWESKGIVITVLLMWKLRLYYFFGVSPDKLHRLYR